MPVTESYHFLLLSGDPATWPAQMSISQPGWALKQIFQYGTDWYAVFYEETSS